MNFRNSKLLKHFQASHHHELIHSLSVESCELQIENDKLQGENKKLAKVKSKLDAQRKRK